MGKENIFMGKENNTESITYIYRIYRRESAFSGCSQFQGGKWAIICLVEPGGEPWSWLIQISYTHTHTQKVCHIEEGEKEQLFRTF